MVRYELSTGVVHIFMSSLPIPLEKQPERKSDESLPFLIDPGPKLQPTFFQFKEEHCLVLVDYYSDCIEFDKMRDKLQINHFPAI